MYIHPLKGISKNSHRKGRKEDPRGTGSRALKLLRKEIITFSDADAVAVTNYCIRVSTKIVIRFLIQVTLLLRGVP